MMRNLRLALTLTAITAAATAAFAVPALRGLRTVTTADGESLSVSLEGDEFFHQYFSEDGYPLLEENGNFYYCDYDESGNTVSSGIKATSPRRRSARARAFLEGIDFSTLEGRIRMRAEKSPRQALQGEKPRRAPGGDTDSADGPPFEKGYGLFSDVHFPAYGSQKAIVILVEYKDVKFNSSYDPYDYFSRMLNEEGFSDYGATGSAAQYFRENSNGAFLPEFDVYGPVTLSKNMAAYGGNDYWGDDKDPGGMVKEACDALDATVDFREYDRDGDGIVDNVFIFYAGLGEASGGSANSVWPHSWTMPAAGYPNLRYDGVQIYTYGCTNEWITYNGPARPDGVGTFIHEFSHVMGLPDLYATTYSNAFTPGEWSVLDYGPYNNRGMTPPNYGAFERHALGWVKPLEIDRALTVTLNPIDENVCGIIRSPKATEFFLVENRQKTGWDTYIPGHGMLIWHIDYNKNAWDSNSVNNQANHQYVDIEEADGRQSNYDVEGDAFPGTSNKTSFTPSTTPAMKTWNGTALNYPITDIVEADGLITFNVLGGAPLPLEAPTALEPYDIKEHEFTARWLPTEGATSYFLTVFTKTDAEVQPTAETDTETDGEEPDETTRYTLPGFTELEVGDVTEYVVYGVEPATEYFYVVRATDGQRVSEESDEISLITMAGTTAVGFIEETGAIRVVGRTVSCASGEEMTAYDLTGVPVARGTGRLTLPDGGVYILTLSEAGKAFKLTIR